MKIKTTCNTFLFIALLSGTFICKAMEAEKTDNEKTEETTQGAINTHSALSPDGKIRITRSADGTLSLWDAQTGEFLETLPETLTEMPSFTTSATIVPTEAAYTPTVLPVGASIHEITPEGRCIIKVTKRKATHYYDVVTGEEGYLDETGSVKFTN